MDRAQACVQSVEFLAQYQGGQNLKIRDWLGTRDINALGYCAQCLAAASGPVRFFYGAEVPLYHVLILERPLSVCLVNL